MQKFSAFYFNANIQVKVQFKITFCTEHKKNRLNILKPCSLKQFNKQLKNTLGKNCVKTNTEKSSL